jgi:two-component system sensor histidine kinase ChvG
VAEPSIRQRTGSRTGSVARRLRRFGARLTVRLLAVNLLLVAVPIASFFYFGIYGYLGVYERQLLQAQESSMAQQARVLAAALGDRGPLAAEDADSILESLGQRLTARLRVVDTDGRVIADSARLGPRLDQVSSNDATTADTPTPEPRESLLYRLGSAPFRVLRALVDDTPEPSDSQTPDDSGAAGPLADRDEIQTALDGRYGAAVRPTPGQRSVTLLVAVPVTDGGRVVGATLASQSTLRVLQALDEVRLALFKVFLISLAAAIALSLVLATTIARPVRRLRREATQLVDGRGRLRGTFSGSDKQDEIGDLARSLEGLSRRLDERVRFVEAFAADVSHELKNPLTSIRAATEMLAEVDSASERRRFLGMVESEVARIERLLSAVREISVIDSRLDEEAGSGPVDLAAVLRDLADAHRLRHPDGPPVELGITTETPVAVVAHADRLAQVFENLLGNAASFSPRGLPVELHLDRETSVDGVSLAVVTVDDQGPGIPAEHLDRIFDRFFTYRPDEPQARRHHTGLGLAIVRTLVESYGGSVEAANRPAGARFQVRLPTVSGQNPVR